MIRKVIQIDEDLCNGCTLCASACHEGAIGMVDGKAKLLRDDYCDGLGNCLPVCPTGAITFVEREAAEFDEEAVEKHMKEIEKTSSNEHHEHHAHHGHEHHTHENHEHHEHNEKKESGNKDMKTETPKSPCGCPSSAAKTFERPVASTSPITNTNASTCNTAAPVYVEEQVSNLRQWPVQIQLVPVNAPYFNGAHLLIAADCAAYSHPSFNQTFMKNKITIIGCPKLDDTDYSEKLTKILANNQIKSVTIVRMEVPCCGGIVAAATQALKDSGKMIPWSVVTLGTDGSVLE